MRYYAVLDTNVLVSAMLKHNSIPAEVLAEALNGDIIPVLNEDILAEYEDAYLVTGNIKHFPIKTYVVTPREMLDIVAEGK